MVQIDSPLVFPGLTNPPLVTGKVAVKLELLYNKSASKE